MIIEDRASREIRGLDLTRGDDDDRGVSGSHFVFRGQFVSTDRFYLPTGSFCGRVFLQASSIDPPTRMHVYVHVR